MTDERSCSERASLSAEPLAGTAETVQCWILLEYPEPWSADALKDNRLPPDAAAWLAKSLQELSTLQLAVRPQFIRQQQRRDKDRLSLFVVHADGPQSRVYRFRFSEHADLAGIDLARLWRSPAEFAAQRYEQALYLVCTNGQRDQCCSVHGMRVYAELSRQVGEAAWQTTHLGGHRFAATLVVFPSGVVYGRMSPAEVHELVQAESAGEVLLDHLRGRSGWDRDLQAAEYFLRQRTGQMDHGRYRLLERQVQDRLLHFSFEDTRDRQRLHVQLKRQQAPLHFQASCGDGGFKSRWIFYSLDAS